MDPELLAQAAERWDSLVANGIHGDEAKRQVDEWLTSQGPSGMQAFGRGAVQGATFGFGDELKGVLRGVGAMVPGGASPGEAYTEHRDIARERDLAAREAHPVAYGAGGFAGGAATAVAGGAALRGAGMVGRAALRPTLGRVSALGAAEGAVQGAGEAEGGLGDRLRGAGTGAAYGGILAPVMVGGGRMLGAGVTRGLDVSGMRPTGAGEGITQAAARRLGVHTKPERIDEMLATRLPDDVTVQRARLQGQVAIAEAGGVDRPLTIMEDSPRLQGTARAARGFEGPAKAEIPDFLQNRVAGQEERILADALDLSGVGERTNVFEHIDDIIARRSQAAETAYSPINDVIVDNPDILGYLKRPRWKKAYERAQADVLEAGGEALPDLESLTEGVPVRILNRVKMALDDELQVASRQGNLARSEMRTIREAKNEFLDLMDEAVPGYADARAGYAGESAMMESFEQGRDLFRRNIHPDEAEQFLAKLGDSERESYVRGALEGMATKIESAASNRDLTKVRPLADITLDKQRLRLLFADDASFDRFRDGIADELSIAQTRGAVTGGSNTAEKLTEMAELAGLDITQLARNPLGGAFRLGMNALRDRTGGYSGELAEGMVEPLTATSRGAVSTLDRLTASRAASASRGAVRERAVAGGAAALVGPAGARDENARRRRLAGRR